MKKNTRSNSIVARLIELNSGVRDGRVQTSLLTDEEEQNRLIELFKSVIPDAHILDDDKLVCFEVEDSNPIDWVKLDTYTWIAEIFDGSSRDFALVRIDIHGSGQVVDLVSYISPLCYNKKIDLNEVRQTKFGIHRDRAIMNHVGHSFDVLNGQLPWKFILQYEDEPQTPGDEWTRPETFNFRGERLTDGLGRRVTK